MTAVLERSGAVADDATQAVSAPVANTMKAKALFTAVSDALLFAAPPAMMVPNLDAVRLEFGGGQLVAAATDRCVLGASRVDYCGESFVVMVAGADAKVLVKMAKTLKRDEGSREVAIEVADDGAQVTFRFSTGESMTVRGLDVQFPQWRQLIPANAARMGGIVGMGYNPTLLAKFAKVRPDEHSEARRMVVFPSVTSSGKPGPTAIRVGKDFIGLLMPIRPAGDEWTYERPDWLETDASVAASGAAEVR